MQLNIVYAQPTPVPPDHRRRVRRNVVGLRHAANVTLATAATYVILACVVSAAEPGPDQVEFFEKRIRPLLADNCFECHSANAKSLKANLRLDSRQAMLAGGDSGPAIVAGKPDESLLIEAVLYQSFEMPPRGKLSPDKIEALVQWIRLGAPWPSDETPPAVPVVEASFDWRRRRQQFWSWQSIQAQAPPPVRDRTWARGPVDLFVLSKLEEKGLMPAQQADRRTLIRRLYFDLIGLPPRREQVRAFLSDDAPGAYQRVVEELLSSSHFGEKWARHWMDLVRYGETCGHEFDYTLPYAYRYRDYLVRALNADVPYDQFVHEHIAGDLLDPPRYHPTQQYNESIIGTGFWFLGEAVHAPTDVRGDEADRIDNQIDVMTKTFLGLTVACARCHDHKFDPIPTADYYALAGYLQSSRRQEAMLDPGGRIGAIAARLCELEAAGTAALRARLANVNPDIHQIFDVSVTRRWQDALATAETDRPSHPFFAWKKLAGSPVSSASPAVFALRRDELAANLAELVDQADAARQQAVVCEDFDNGRFSSWRVTGEAFGDTPTSVGQWDSLAEADQVALPGVAHSGLRAKQLRGVLRSPTFELKHRRIHYRMLAESAQVRLIVDGYTMDVFNPLLFADITLEHVDTEGEYRWVTQHRDLEHYLGHRAHIEIIDHGDGFAAVDEILFSDADSPPDPPHPWNLAVAGDPTATSLESVAELYARKVAQLIGRWQAGADEPGDTEVINWLSQHDLLPRAPRLTELRDKMNPLRKGVPAPLHVMALADGDGEDERIHIRGSHKNLGATTPRHLLVAIAGEDQPAATCGSGRLQLARRITDPSNPFTSRVIVNRLWHHLFGRGIVPTVDDFGKMGLPPSHPELLDWLAQDFIDHDWSIKHAIRQMVLSSTYRMSSENLSSASDVGLLDADNRLLHRAPIRRLTAEAIRDSLLSVSGSLDRTMFGPSVPVHLTPFMEGRGRPRSGPLDGDGRRSIYVQVSRNFLAPMMLAFDMPIPFSTMGRRSNSNVPAQSLIMMNHPLVRQQSERWASELLASEASTEQRMVEAFETAFAHPPSELQVHRARDFIKQQAALYESDEQDVRVWQDLCHMLVNMKDFIYLR